MKLILSSAFALAGLINAQNRLNIPSGPQAGIAAIFEDAFPTHLDELKKHGCWCAYAHSDNTDGMGGVKPVDYLDDLCRRWFSARRCTVLKDGDCRNDKDDAYVLITDPWYSCYKNSKVCDTATCGIDVHFKDLVDTYINDLVATDGAFTATEKSECIRVFPLERPAAPHVMKSTFYCTGTSPDIKRTDYYDDSFAPTVGDFTQAQAQKDEVRATASDAAVFVDFDFTPNADYDQWTIWNIDVSGDVVKMETKANLSIADYSSFVTHPWIVTLGEETIFGASATFLCGYAAGDGKASVSFKVVGNTCTVS